MVINERKHKNHRKGERGIAIILALIMLLVMSVLAITISFNSNMDFRTMSNYKRGQEAFLAAERCVALVRNQFETLGIEVIFFQLQSNNPIGLEELIAKSGVDCNTDPELCAVCRTGQREFNRTSPSDPAPFVDVPPPSKTTGRPIKHTSLASGGLGGAALVTTTFVVTGKDVRDEDKDDTDPDINTGTEIAGGFETFVPGGASNVY